MSKIAIIPARGGSKRIPRKNLKDFCGKPIIAYSIEAALASNLFDEVMVSTDDSDIASISREYGASVPFMRSPESSDDFATTASVLSEVLEKYTSHGKSFEYACCIYATAPFVTAKKLVNAFDLLVNNNFDTVLPIQPYSFPIQRAFFKANDRVEWLNSENALTRSQDLAKAFHDVGQFYFFRVNSFLNTGQLITSNTGAIEVSELEAQDIDNETDWKLAELKFRLLIS